MAKDKTIREHIAEISSAGGKARAANMTAEERSESARNAAKKRWSMPKAAYGSDDRPLKIGNIEIPCYVLDNGTRVISHRGLQSSLSMSVKGSATETAGFIEKIERKGQQANDLTARLLEPIVFMPKRGGTAFGYEATVLADFCDYILSARSDGLLTTALQQRVAERCEILLRGFARVGIIALVDEATGYQEARSKKALADILDKFIAAELRKWTKRFPDEFYEHIFRLNGWSMNPFSVKRPIRAAQLTNDYVYERLAPGILDELKRKNPTDEHGRRKSKYHQWLTQDVGDPRLQQHISAVLALMRVADTKEQLKAMLDKALPKYQDIPLFAGLDDEQ